MTQEQIEQLRELIIKAFVDGHESKYATPDKDYVDQALAGAALTAPSAGVDLAAAEKHVDKVLEAETTESLTKWMKQQQPSAGVWVKASGTILGEAGMTIRDFLKGKTVRDTETGIITNAPFVFHNIDPVSYTFFHKYDGTNQITITIKHSNIEWLDESRSGCAPTTDSGYSKEQLRDVFDAAREGHGTDNGFTFESFDDLEKCNGEIKPSRSASQPGVDTDNLRASIAEVLKEREGYWQTCTGCHESEDGHDVGHYPFSDTFQCKLGSGCHECGGIGAVWEHYPDKTTDTDHSPSLPPDGVQELVEALEKITKQGDYYSVIDIAAKSLTAYKNAKP